MNFLNIIKNRHKLNKDDIDDILKYSKLENRKYLYDILSIKTHNIDWNVVYSRIEVQYNNNNKKIFWRINEQDTTNGNITTTLKLENFIDIKKIEFYPLDDIEGYSCLLSCRINDNDCDIENLNKLIYMPKQIGCYNININNKFINCQEIEFVWNYQFKINK